MSEELEMNEEQQTAFDIISQVGAAKSLYMEIIQLCEQREFNNIDKLMEEAESYLIAGHKEHTKLVQKEAQGNIGQYSLLLVHAEDQLMNAETLKFIAQKFIHLYKEELK
ncbi:PTS lactose/cellobiose transporter subunit IIA [Clostridioides sp. ZZV15-6383]|uniref:PTS lactose/cellobiose transporter subunit IIA n=1 Tax=Clostridioides sp. ZZV15-6383 TaxID=2811498 RepID=UPI001D0FF5A2|nr:PTS lactose/cellobiose transporter subunit IIA [Clostridioides sp. ZZV15-6383]